MRVAALGQGSQHDFALVALHLGRPHLDELVRREGTLDFGHDRFGQALSAQRHDGVQRMGAGFERAALDGGQWFHG